MHEIWTEWKRVTVSNVTRHFYVASFQTHSLELHFFSHARDKPLQVQLEEYHCYVTAMLYNAMEFLLYSRLNLFENKLIAFFFFLLDND